MTRRQSKSGRRATRTHEKHAKGAVLLFALLLSVAGGCASEPRFQRCSNGGECERVDAKYAFCVEGRCVQCIGRGSCGEHKACEDGVCVESSR